MKWFAAVLCWAALTSPAGAGVKDWDEPIAEASRRFGIPRAWIERVMDAESGGRLMLGGLPVVSRTGAMGLMQLMPGTWAAMQSRHALGPNPFDPRDNILAGAAYLRAMYDRFGYPGLFAAYNAGPRRYAAYIGGTARLPAETRAYLAKTAPLRLSQTAQPSPPPALLLSAAERLELLSKPPGFRWSGQADQLFLIRR